MNKPKRDEVSGVYRLTERKTLPPPTRVKFRPSGVIIGSKIPPPHQSASGVAKMPPPPAKVNIPPMTDDIIKLDETDIIIDEPKPAVSQKTEKLKMMLGGRAPVFNDTGIKYDDFVDGITDVKKIKGLKSPHTGKSIKVLVLETNFGKYVFSDVNLTRLRDIDPGFMGYIYNGNGKMTFKFEGKAFYLEELIKERDRDSRILICGEESMKMGTQEYMDMDAIRENVLKKIDNTEAERIINRVEEEQLLNGMGFLKVEEVEIVDDEPFDLHITARTDKNSEYYIFLKRDGATKKEYNLPKMTGLVEVSLTVHEEGKEYEMEYAVLRYKATNDSISFDLNEN